MMRSWCFSGCPKVTQETRWAAAGSARHPGQVRQRLRAAALPEQQGQLWLSPQPHGTGRPSQVGPALPGGGARGGEERWRRSPPPPARTPGSAVRLSGVRPQRHRSDTTLHCGDPASNTSSHRDTQTVLSDLFHSKRNKTKQKPCKVPHRLARNSPRARRVPRPAAWPSSVTAPIPVPI